MKRTAYAFAAWSSSREGRLTPVASSSWLPSFPFPDRLQARAATHKSSAPQGERTRPRPEWRRGDVEELHPAPAQRRRQRQPALEAAEQHDGHPQKREPQCSSTRGRLHAPRRASPVVLFGHRVREKAAAGPPLRVCLLLLTHCFPLLGSGPVSRDRDWVWHVHLDALRNTRLAEAHLCGHTSIRQAAGCCNESQLREDTAECSIENRTRARARTAAATATAPPQGGLRASKATCAFPLGGSAQSQSSMTTVSAAAASSGGRYTQSSSSSSVRSTAAAAPSEPKKAASGAETTPISC